jgi:hypothetical protein
MPKRAIESFAFQGDDGIPVVINSEDTYADDHDIVKSRPDMFRDTADDPVIEKATRGPGEKRATRRPE